MKDPARIGRFEIVRELGRGAMGLVYLAHDPKIERQVAIKTIHKSAALPEAEAEESRQRFMREAQAAGKLIHQGIVTIFDVGEDQGISYIAMEYIEGKNLEAATKPEHLLPADQVVRLMIQACHALDYAHQHRIIHRDVKPANLMVVGERQLKITDFGLAKNPSANLTSAGTLIGTPNYMSPEQIMGKPLDGRSDLFSLGVVLYELLTGEKPFGGDTVSTIIYKVLHEHPKPPDAVNPRVPSALAKVLMKSIDKDPARRHQSGAEFAAELQSWLEADAAVAAAAKAGAPAPSTAGPPAKRPGPPLKEAARVVPAAAPARRRRRVLLPILLILLVGVGAAATYRYVPEVQELLARLVGGAGGGRAEAPGEGGGADVASGTPADLAGPEVDLPAAPPQGEAVSISVETDPPGGEIYLDDRRVVGGSILLAKEDTTTHTLVAENECFVDRASVQAGAAESVVIPLQTPKLHTIRVASEPEGATIYLDGEAQDERTPADLALTACEAHTIELRKSGFERATREFSSETVWADVSPLLLRLERLPEGFVAVKAPYPVQVLKDGRRIGTSGENVKLPAGSHRLTFVNRDLFVSVSATVEVQGDKTVTPKLKFPGVGELTIHANPSNGTVYVNGREIGPPPIIGHSLAEGTYQVRYEVESGPSEERTVLVIAGQPRTEKFILKP